LKSEEKLGGKLENWENWGQKTGTKTGDRRTKTGENWGKLGTDGTFTNPFG
jgi:hypothetical protein